MIFIRKQVQKSAKSFYGKKSVSHMTVMIIEVASSIDIKSVKVPLLKVSKTKPESGSSQGNLLNFNIFTFFLC